MCVGRLDAGRDVVISNITDDRLRGIWPDQHRVPVRVDQAGHQGAFDDVAFDKNVGQRGKRTTLTVEDPNILKQCRGSAGGRRRIALRMNGVGQTQANKRQSNEKDSSERRSHTTPPGRTQNHPSEDTNPQQQAMTRATATHSYVIRLLIAETLIRKKSGDAGEPPPTFEMDLSRQNRHAHAGRRYSVVAGASIGWRT